MVIMKIGARTILSAQIVANRQYILKLYVKVLQNVPTVGKATMPTLRNVKFGIKKKTLRVKFTRNVSFPEGRKIVESPTPIPGSSYASVIKPTTKHVSVRDLISLMIFLNCEYVKVIMKIGVLNFKSCLILFFWVRIQLMSQILMFFSEHLHKNGIMTMYMWLLKALFFSIFFFGSKQKPIQLNFNSICCFILIDFRLSIQQC